MLLKMNGWPLISELESTGRVIRVSQCDMYFEYTWISSLCECLFKYSIIIEIGFLVIYAFELCIVWVELVHIVSIITRTYSKALAHTNSFESIQSQSSVLGRK